MSVLHEKIVRNVAPVPLLVYLGHICVVHGEDIHVLPHAGHAPVATHGTQSHTRGMAQWSTDNSEEVKVVCTIE